MLMSNLYFEKYANFERKNEPTNVSIPFAKGSIRPENVQNLKITSGEETAVVQTLPLSYWDDGSVKWCKVDFFANLPANKDKTYQYSLGSTPTSSSKGVSLTYKEDKIIIDNGCILLTLNNCDNLAPFSAFSQGNFTVSNEQICGPFVVDESNVQYTASLAGPWEVQEHGSVLTKLSAKGSHKSSEGSSFLDFIIDITVYVDTPWFELNYRIINRESPEIVYINKVAFTFRLSQELCKNYTLTTSNYKSDIQTKNDGSDLHITIDSKYLLNDANEHTPEAFYGTFFADWSSQEGGICTTLYQAYQNCPKALKVNKEMLEIEILPEGYPLKYYRGMAKSHRMFIHLHDNNETIDNLNKRSLMLQHIDKPLLSPEVYEKSGVYQGIFATKRYEPFEDFLVSIADNRGKAYGILHWGDCPDSGYSQQGRGGGEYVWTNNEYDFPLAAMQMFTRSGIRRMLDYALVSARHWTDIDVCHHDPDPLKHGSQIEHSKEHVTGNIEISHEWVEGLFAYYHQTGCRFAFDTAIGIGKNIMRHLDEPRYQQKGEINARETGWALRALIAIYQETNDKAWLKHVEFIVSHFRAWKDIYGGWFAPYTCHTVVRVPFMISVAACSLMRYYRVFPSTEIKDMIVDAVDDLIENTMLENGLFYYKEIPSLRRPGTNPIVLEALAYAYELTGDEKYLQAGIPTFLLNLKRKTSSGGKKEIIDGGLLIPGTGPKGFAQSFFPVAYYYGCVAKSGIALPDEKQS